MTGPPTPPLTTEAEIQDAARNSVSSQVAPMATDSESVDPAPSVPEQTEQPATTAPPAVESQKTAYEVLFTALARLSAQGKYRELVFAAEQGDCAAATDSHFTRLFAVAPLVLGYLILDDVPAARHVLTRLPENLARLPVSNSLFSLLAAVHARKHEAVYARAEELYNLCLQPGFSYVELGTVLAAMTTAFIEEFRRKTFALLEKAYTSISAPLAMGYLGLPGDQIFTVAESNGWTYDASTQILTPPPCAQKGASTTDSSVLATLNAVVDSIVRA